MIKATRATLVLLATILINFAHAQTVTYLHTDELGTPIAETDATGNIIRTTEYSPFGEPLNRSGGDSPGYTGHVEDALTGLTYMQQRYMDPALGRFVSVDPVTSYESGEWRLFNRYSYAFDNPFGFSDPDGRCPACFAVAGRMALGATLGAGVEVAMQTGEQVIFEGKRSWSEIDIDGSDVAVSAGIGAVMPGMGSVALRAKSAAPVIRRSVGAIRRLAQQSRRTANRAAKLAARENRHVTNATTAAAEVAETAGAATTGVVISKLGKEAANREPAKEKEPQVPPSDNEKSTGR